ncbi:hypothetical protein ACFWAR_00760 [Streptomyces sp. NPDC059917]|uniref:hypothetical protein n=1 Tax=Streptomyces sp. NPDC059917 TaxID=3347002 RepID=UPI00365ABDD7
MKAVALYTILWAVTAGVAWRCWRRWRQGADQLWPAKWGALSVTLLTLAFSMALTLHPLGVAPAVTISLVTVLLGGAAASMIATHVSVRRADAATRAMRTGLGLPVERRMWRPATIGILWCTGAFLLLMVWVLSISFDEQRLEREQAFNAGLAIAFCVIVVGLVHAGVQKTRISREQQRVRDAEVAYLSPDSERPQ